MKPRHFLCPTFSPKDRCACSPLILNYLLVSPLPSSSRFNHNNQSRSSDSGSAFSSFTVYFPTGWCHCAVWTSSSLMIIFLIFVFNFASHSLIPFTRLMAYWCFHSCDLFRLFKPCSFLTFPRMIFMRSFVSFPVSILDFKPLKHFLFKYWILESPNDPNRCVFGL